MFGTNIPWPNPQNSLDTIYWFFTGQHLAVGASGSGALYFIQELALIGVLLSACFLVAFIYQHLSLERLYHQAHMERRNREQTIAQMMRTAATEHPNRARWQRTLELMNSQNPNDWRSAIMDADVMLDAMLTDRGFVGEDVGEKLQSASRGTFASIEAAWDAHRIRNQVAHGGGDFMLTERDARRAIEGYRRSLEEFGYL